MTPEEFHELCREKKDTETNMKILMLRMLKKYSDKKDEILFGELARFNIWVHNLRDIAGKLEKAALPFHIKPEPEEEPDHFNYPLIPIHPSAHKRRQLAVSKLGVKQEPVTSGYPDVPTTDNRTSTDVPTSSEVVSTAAVLPPTDTPSAQNSSSDSGVSSTGSSSPYDLILLPEVYPKKNFVFPTNPLVDVERCPSCKEYVPTSSLITPTKRPGTRASRSRKNSVSTDAVLIPKICPSCNILKTPKLRRSARIAQSGKIASPTNPLIAPEVLSSSNTDILITAKVCPTSNTSLPTDSLIAPEVRSSSNTDTLITPKVCPTSKNSVVTDNLNTPKEHPTARITRSSKPALKLEDSASTEEKLKGTYSPPVEKKPKLTHPVEDESSNNMLHKLDQMLLERSQTTVLKIPKPSLATTKFATPVSAFATVRKSSTTDPKKQIPIIHHDVKNAQPKISEQMKKEFIADGVALHRTVANISNLVEYNKKLLQKRVRDNNGEFLSSIKKAEKFFRTVLHAYECMDCSAGFGYVEGMRNATIEGVFDELFKLQAKFSKWHACDNADDLPWNMVLEALEGIIMGLEGVRIL